MSGKKIETGELYVCECCDWMFFLLEKSPSQGPRYRYRVMHFNGDWAGLISVDVFTRDQIRKLS